MIGTSDGEQFNTPFEHAIAVGGPASHPPQWIGNKQYGDVFDWVDKNSQSSQFALPTDWKEFDMEKDHNLKGLNLQQENPPKVPDFGGERGPGQWNRVSSTDPTIGLGSPEKPAGALKTDLGTQVAINPPLPANDNKNLQIPTPNMDDIFEKQWNDMVKKGTQPDLRIVPKEPGKESSLSPSVVSVLSQPHIAEAIANPKIDRTHDVPYVAGASAKSDDFTTHVDQHIPTTATISGKTFDPAIPLNIHEQVEREVMNNLIKKGMTNEKAYEIAHHEYAEPAEDAWYKAQGIDVKDVNHWWDQQNKITEKEKSTDLKFPPNLYKKPYPHDEVEGMKHEHSNVSAEWATSTKVAMNDQLKYNPADALNPMAEPARLPAAPKGVPESIYSAAIRHPDGEVHLGFSHADAMLRLPTKRMDEITGQPRESFEASQGFITNKGRFVSRKEAAEIAEQSKQIPNYFAKTLNRAGLGLTSEDLDTVHPPVESVRGALKHFFQNSEPKK